MIDPKMICSVKSNKRILSYLFISFGFLLVTACNKVGRSAKFDLDYNASFTLQDTCQVGVEYDFFKNIGTNSQDTFALENTNNDLVKTIRMTKLDLSVTAPVGYDFQPLDTVKVYMSAPGYSNALIAEETNIFQFATDIQFDDFLDTDYKFFVFEDELLYNLKVTFDDVLTSDITVNLHCRFHVDAEEVQD